jgi:ankyrin repeat protein
LILAANVGNQAAVQALLEKGADVAVKDKYAYTAMMYAKRDNQNNIVEMLKNAGAKQ